MKSQIITYIRELEKKLSAARVFLETLTDVQTSPISPDHREAVSEPETNHETKPENYGNQTRLLKEVIRSGVDFDVSNVEQWLTAAGKKMERALISQVLSRLKRSGYISVISQGSGKRASIYRLTEKL